MALRIAVSVYGSIFWRDCLEICIEIHGTKTVNCIDFGDPLAWGWNVVSEMTQ